MPRLVGHVSIMAHSCPSVTNNCPPKPTGTVHASQHAQSIAYIHHNINFAIPGSTNYKQRIKVHSKERKGMENMNKDVCS